MDNNTPDKSEMLDEFAILFVLFVMVFLFAAFGRF